MSTPQRVRSILIDRGIITLIKRIKENDVYYAFPGGGVEEGEGVPHALMREIKEELGIEISVGELFMDTHFNRQGEDQLESFFLCTTLGGVLGTGDGPEFQPGNTYEGTREIVQLPIPSIKDIRVLPLEVRDRVVLEFNNE